MSARFLLALCLLLATALTSFARAQNRGVINDPDGFTNVRVRASTESPVVAKVIAGEVFAFESRAGSFAEWVKVTLASGQTGWMHASRVRFHAAPTDIVDGGPGDELNVYARREGLDYYALARAAAKGEPAAMKRYFAFRGDGAAAETHQTVLCTVMHLLGDEKLAKALDEGLSKDRTEFRAMIEEGNTLWPFEPVGYLKRNFPKTAKVLRLP